MRIILNGSPAEIPDHSPMSALIERLELGGARFAVEVNEEILPRSRFQDYRIAPADRVEIIQAVGGG